MLGGVEPFKGISSWKHADEIEDMETRKSKHTWHFKARFRRNAFGWRSQLPVKRVKEAVSEIKKAARRDKVLAAEGAVAFLERVSPALAHVDSSSGAVGTAVNRAIEALVPIIASAPADRKTREEWLERLFEAHEDRIPYIEGLADYWAELCGSPEVASQWADELIEFTRKALGPERKPGRLFHGTPMCLSALYAAGRYGEIVDLLREETFWWYSRWAVKALVAQGKKAEAVRWAEACRSPRWNEPEIDAVCEEILLSSGLAEDAYDRYGLTANCRGTYLAWFRAVAKKYPHKRPWEVLADLVALTPGKEGKWFAAAKDAGLLDEAIALANHSPCAPDTLTRAARDFKETNPGFAAEAGMAALRWLVEGYGYEITGLDVETAYDFTLEAAGNAGMADACLERIRDLVAGKAPGARFVRRVLARRLGPL